MKLELGDFVSYKTKKIDVEGILIAYENGCYYIHPTKRKGVSAWRHGIYANSSGTYFVQEYFTGSRHYKVSVNPCVYVSRRSKNVKSNMKEYDPTQMGDTDDDI